MSGAVVRSVVVRLTSEVSGLVRGYRVAGAEGDKLKDGLSKTTGESEKLKGSLLGSTKESKKLRDAIGGVGKVAGAIGLVAATGLGVAVTKAADFEQGMSNVDAATHATVKTMGRYRDAAIDAGQRTQYSATEAAGAIENLAKAGVGTNDILKGGLNGSLNLAAAGGLEVADAAETAATALTTFSLNGREMSHVADLLAAGAGKAQGDVDDLAQALKQAGLLASQSGMGIEETVATLAAFASKGLLGSDAGTSLKTFLLQLVPSTTAAYNAMESYGLVAYDANEASKTLAKDGIHAVSSSYEDVYRAVSKWLVAQGVAKEGTGKLAKKTQEYMQHMGLLHSQFTESNGDFKSMADIAGVLHDKLKNLSDSDRQAALKKIFGTDAVRAANVLFEQGAKGMENWKRKVDDAGYAAETAKRKTDNLRGDIERMGGALDTALITTGTGAQGPLREAVQSVTGLIDEYNKLPDVAKSGVLKLLGYTAVVGGGVFVFSKVLQGIAATQAALATLGSSISASMLAFKLGAGIAGGALLLLSDNIGEVNETAGYVASAAGGAFLGFAAAGPIGAAIGAGAGLLYNLQKANDDAAQSFRDSIKFQEDYAAALEASNGQIDDQVKKTVYRNLMNSGALGVGQDIGIKDRDLVAATLGDEGAIKRVTARVKELTAANDKQAASGKYFFNKESAADFLFSLKNMGNAVDDDRKKVLAQLEAIKTWRAALKGIPKKVFTELKNKDFAPTFDQVMRLQRQYKLTPKQVNTIFRETGVGVTADQVLQLQRQMHLTPKQLVTLVKQTGVALTAQQVQGLVRRYDLTPKEKKTFFKALGIDEAIGMVRRFQREILTLHGKTVTVRADARYGQTAQVGTQPGKLLAGNAYGGAMTAYQDHWVGENGPEVVRTMMPARVIPNNQLQRGVPVATGGGLGGHVTARLSDRDVGRIVHGLAALRPMYGDVTVHGDRSFERDQRLRAAAEGV